MTRKLHVSQCTPVIRVFALLLLLLTALPVWSQIDRGTIQGLVKDESGGVVPGAKVQIIGIDTGSVLDLTTDGAGLYVAPNLPAAKYRVEIEKTGFQKFVRQPVEVVPRATATVDVVLRTGSLTETVSVTSDAPLLDTAAANNSVDFKDTLVEQLPLIVTGTKRDITSFLDNMPGTTQTNTFIPTVNASVTGATQAFIDGAPSTEILQKGSLQENGPFLEQVDQVTVVTGAFNAEYGGFGNWFTNVVIKSGTNELHGSVFDHLGNDVLNARAFFLAKRTPYRQNEGGFTLGGPVVIPHVYNGRNKTFFFASLGLYYSRVGTGGAIITIPTPAFMAGNFSGLVNAAGVQIPIYDPSTSQPDGKGSYSRTPFPGNIIPASRIVGAAQIVASYIPAPTSSGDINNFIDHKAPTWPYYNTTVPLIKIDQNISSKQKVMFSYTHQTRPRLLWGNPGSGLGPEPIWGQPQTNPLDWITDQQDTSWKIRLSHDYIISPTLVNHVTLAGDWELNIGPNGTDGQGWDKKLGITGIPDDNGSFPAINFSGGTASPVNFGRAYDAYFHAMHYSVIENLTWIHGKHSMKYGVEIDRDQINQDPVSNEQGTFNFTNSMTSNPDGSNYGTAGSSVASFLLGAVSSASAYLPVYTAPRMLRVGAFAQDEWRATSKLTVSYGLRWDFNPAISERQNKMSSFEPNIPNPGAAGRLGALAFAGQSGLIAPDFAINWKRGFGPRLGFSYQVAPKMVIRASSGIYYATSIQDLGTGSFSGGFSNSPSFSSPDGYTPLYYIPTGIFPQNFARPPVIDPTFLNGQAITWVDSNVTRLPQTLNYTISVQREMLPNLSVEAVYLGMNTTHLSFAENDNYMPLSYLSYGTTLTSNIASAAAVAAGFSSPYPAFAGQTGANTVYQALRPYPQYTTITHSAPDGHQKFNELEIKANKRFAKGLTMFGYFTWMKSFTLATGQYPGWRFWQLDPNPAASFSTSWAYELPFGHASSSRPVNAIVSGWKINGFVKYSSGVPLTISAAAGNLGSVGYSQWGNAVTGVSPYLTTSPANFNPATSKFLNAAAFTTSTGFNFGNLNPNLSWVRGFWYKEENLSVGRIFSIKERVKLDFSVDAFNPFNFVRWSNPNTTLTSSAFGTVTATANPRTLQVNAAVRF
jgi:hypothetical protein